MDKYKPTIGLEIHAELKTKTKMFCRSKNDPNETQPNFNVCPICMGHPGTLPVVNKEAVRSILMVGVALNGKLADFTEFDRKNYFYPDIPKGYQISQFKYPLVLGGKLGGIKLTRIHLEEDTASSIHDEGDYSLVDFNRAGVPLMELVTEPMIESAKQASDFARELRILLRCLNVAEANMEMGQMRVEANISVSATNKFGTKVEVKNLNSFRSVERAIDYEINRHVSLLDKGKTIEQETRGWDESKSRTYSQRSKEDSHDYRYFPDPDIPPFYLSEFPEYSEDILRKSLPELPWQKRNRYVKDYKLRAEDAEIFISDAGLSDRFEKIITQLAATNKSRVAELTKLAMNYITSDFLGIRKKNEKAKLPEDFSDLIVMLDKGEISSRGAKDILTIASDSKGNLSVRKIAEEKGLLQRSDRDVLETIVYEVISENQKVVADYKSGKLAALQYLVGQGMKKSKGSANPAALRQVFEEDLK